MRFLQLQYKPEKNSGSNGIWTHDLRVTSAMLYELSYEATHWEQVNCEFILTHLGKFQSVRSTNIRSRIFWTFPHPPRFYGRHHLTFKFRRLGCELEKVTSKAQKYLMGEIIITISIENCMKHKSKFFDVLHPPCCVPQFSIPYSKNPIRHSTLPIPHSSFSMT